MLRYDLKGKTALVTGAASGIGLATAAMLGRNGAKVAINFLPDDARGPKVIDQLKGQGIDAIPAPGNVGAAGDAERMIATAIQSLGRLDLLVSNAGTPAPNAKSNRTSSISSLKTCGTRCSRSTSSVSFGARRPQHPR